MNHPERFRNVLCAALAHMFVLAVCTYMTLPHLGSSRETLPLIENTIQYSLWALMAFLPFLWIRLGTYVMISAGAVITAFTYLAALWNALAVTEHLAVTGKPGYAKGGYEWAILGLPMIFCATFVTSFVILQIGQLAGRQKTVEPPPIVKK